jgi:hypothetical protein
LPPISGLDVVEPNDPALKSALDRAFDEHAISPRRWVKAVVIARDGRIVAEHNAPSLVSIRV